MIYQMYWAGMQGQWYRSLVYSDDMIKQRKDYLREYGWMLPFKIGKTYLYKNMVRDRIIGNDKDTHVFIVTSEQHSGFKAWLKAEKLEDYVFYKSPKAQRNENYPDSEPRLWLYVLCGPNNINRKEK